MKQVLYFKTVVGKVEEKATGDVSISGYGSTKDIDRGNDKVLPSAFEETLKNNASTSGVAMLLGHDDSKVIGGWDTLATDARGLMCEGTVKYDTDGCKQKIKNGDLRGLSIGYIVEEYHIENKEGVVVYRSSTGMEAGHDWDELWNEDAVRVITKLNLVEISIVSTPMNQYSFISSVKKFWSDEVKSLKAMAPAKEKKEGDDQGDQGNNDQGAGDEGGEQVSDEGKGTIETEKKEETPAGAPAGGGEDQGAGAGSQEGGGGENAGGNPAPVVPENAPISQEKQLEILQKAKDDMKNEFFGEVKTLVQEMLEKALFDFQNGITGQFKSVTDALAGLNDKLGKHEEAFKNIEVQPGGTTAPRSAGLARKSITDADIMRTLGL